MIDSIIRFILETIFHGAFISILFLGSFRLFKIRIELIDTAKLTRAIGCTLLAASLIYLIALMVPLFRVIGANDYQRYMILNRFFGPYWWAFWIFFFLPYFLLPQIFWLKKIKQNIVAVLMVTFVWEFLFTIRMYTPYYGIGGVSSWRIYYAFERFDYFIKFLIYLPLLSVVYFILSRRKSA